jgi:ankyrin repeat protein
MTQQNANCSTFFVNRAIDYALIIAAYNGDAATVRSALSSGADPDVRTRNGYTPLHWLSMRSLVADDPITCTAALVSAGANVDHLTPDGASPLSLACAAGLTELVAYLLAAGANPDPPHPAEPPLHRALPSLERVRLLIKAGAPTLAVSREGGRRSTSTSRAG